MTCKRWSKVSDGVCIVVDWKSIARCQYFPKTVKKIVPNVGECIAKLIIQLNLSPKSIEMMGHSLGAHICSYTGHSLIDSGAGKLKTIFGKTNLFYPSIKQYILLTQNTNCLYFIMMLNNILIVQVF